MTQTAAPVVSDPLHSVNPATGAVIAIVPVHSAEAVQAAVDQAREAAPWWAGRSFGERAAYLLRWRTYLHDHADELVELIHTENGKPHEDAYLELALHRLGGQAREQGAGP